jgi:glycosyltransferase involved in cell wall biosynthesis
MRVLFVEPNHSEALTGGAEVQARKTKAELERFGVQVDLSIANQIQDCSQYDLVHIFNLLYHQSAQAAYRAAQQAGVPIIVSPILWDLTDYLFSKARRWQRFIKLGTRNSRILFKVKSRLKVMFDPSWLVQRQILSDSVAILPNSKAEIRFLRSYFLLANLDRRAFVIPNGIDRSLYDPLPEPNIDFCQKYGIQDFVLQVGRVETIKNQLGLIQALDNVRVPIVFVGRTDDQQYYSQCVNAAKNHHQVIFIKPIPYEQLPGIYAAAKVHVLPSWRETPGLVSLEAAAAGCGIVTTNIGCAQEYFGDYAQYCYPTDHLSLREAVVSALEAPRSLCLRDRVLGNYTWTKAAETTLNVYKYILGRDKTHV